MLDPAKRTRVSDSRVSLERKRRSGAVRGTVPEGHTVTRDRARKKAIRARMAVSGEPYSVAARTLAAAEPTAAAAAVREVIARVNRTMAAPSARIEVRVDNEIILAERPERRRRGPAGRLARAAWKGIASTAYATRLRDMFPVLAGRAELTVWIDDAYIRRIESAEHASGQYSSVTKRLTIELWDFGVAIDSLDWSRLPSFRTPG